MDHNRRVVIEHSMIRDEVSDDNSETNYPKVVSNPIFNMSSRRKVNLTNRIVVDRKNPWGQVAGNWTNGLGLEDGDSNFLRSLEEVHSMGVKDRLGRRKIDQAKVVQDDYVGKTDWNVKLKKPRMTMVADLEEEKLSVKERLYFRRIEVGKYKGNLSTRQDSQNNIGGVLLKQRGNCDESVDSIPRKLKNVIKTDREWNTTRGINIANDLRETKDNNNTAVNAGSRSMREVTFSNSDVNIELEDSEDSLENDNGSDIDIFDSNLVIEVIGNDHDSSDGADDEFTEIEVKRMSNKKKGVKAEGEDNRTIVVKNKTCLKRQEKLKKENLLLKRKKGMSLRDKINPLNKHLLLEDKNKQYPSPKAKKVNKQHIRNKRSGVKERSSSPSSESMSSSSSDSSDSSDGHSDSCSSSSEREDQKSRTSRSRKNMKLSDRGKLERRELKTPSKIKLEQKKQNEDASILDLKSKLKKYLNRAKK